MDVIDNRLATPKQTFALFCGTKVDCRNLGLTITAASSLISRMKSGENIAQELLNMGGKPKGEAKLIVNFEAIYAEADRAGREAAENHKPTPMIVCEHANPLNDNSTIVRQYAPIEGGVCGFAWIWFKGNTAWGRWATKAGHASDAYPTGKSIWVSGYGQSMERKEKYADAFAKVLRDNGITAYAQSRMD